MIIQSLERMNVSLRAGNKLIRLLTVNLQRRRFLSYIINVSLTNIAIWN